VPAHYRLKVLTVSVVREPGATKPRASSPEEVVILGSGGDRFVSLAQRGLL
jgi:hypothetical protein